jgi:hypothetical protein
MIHKISIYSLRFLVLASLLVIGCRKNDVGNKIEGVTNHVWKFYSIQETNDNFINPIPANWEFTLNSNKTFSAKIDGQAWTGQYTWDFIDDIHATVSFTMNESSNTTQNSDLADKLMNILESVNICTLNLEPDLVQEPAPPPIPAPTMRFEGTEGYFNLFR